MTYLSRLSFFTVLDLIKAGKVSAREALRLAGCHRWLSRTGLDWRLAIRAMLRGMAVLAFSVPFLASAQVGDVTLQWTSAVPLSTNQTFVLRGSPTMTGNPTNWPVLTHVSGLTTQTVVRITPGAHFFVAQASNLWGFSPPSNVASVPALPVSPLLTIQGAQ